MSTAVTRYRPKDVPPEWELVADGVRMVALTTSGAMPYSVTKVMLVIGRLAVYSERHATARDPLLWLQQETADRFLIAQTGLKPSTIQTYRAVINRVREALLWLEQRQPLAVKMRARKTRQQPYTPAELARYAMWARTLPATADVGRSALALLALGAGCGLVRREVLSIRGSDIRPLSSGVVAVKVPGSDRLLICRAAWEEVLADLAKQAGEDRLFYPQRVVDEPKNGLTNWAVRVLRNTHGLPPLRLARLRSSWITELLRARVPDDVVAAAAGMKSTSGLAFYREFVPPVTTEEAARLLRGQAV